MIELEKAKETLFNYTSLMSYEKESVSLWEVSGRVLAEDFVATENVPSFHRSPIDGYALLAEDTLTATTSHPINLKIIDTVAAGSYSHQVITPGTTIKIFTGAPLPAGANCIIKKEEVLESTDSSDTPIVTVKRSVNKGESITSEGEDISCGELLFHKGTVIDSAHMGVLATLGVDPVPVYKKPNIGVFSTGNELVDLHTQLQHGQLRASNIYSLAEIIRQAGGTPINLGVIKDKVEDLIKVYQKAEQLRLPLVISTGGTASGDFDLINEAMDGASSTRLFNKVAIRPGAPVVASVRKRQLLIGLSGNPAGAATAMYLILFPVISKLAGSNRELVCIHGRLTIPYSRKKGLLGFLWANYHEHRSQIKITPLKNQYCGALKSYAMSNCLMEVPAGFQDYKAGDLVNLWKLP